MLAWLGLVDHEIAVSFLRWAHGVLRHAAHLSRGYVSEMREFLIFLALVAVMTAVVFSSTQVEPQKEQHAPTHHSEEREPLLQPEAVAAV
mmetsp:Transcript_35118/g.76885  ORF Transcript_35118/g.76885 Transcript_35118/m.76885 type:complete len:90 (-) Transcript_35118:27-296(-)